MFGPFGSNPILTKGIINYGEAWILVLFANTGMIQLGLR